MSRDRPSGEAVPWWPSLRSVLKRSLERTAVRTGIDRLGRLLRRSRTLVLAYHNVVPHRATRQQTGAPSLHLPFDAFRRQIDFLSDRFDLASLEGALTGEGRRSLPRAVITFDDGYRGVLDTALPYLAERGIPSTTFVVPSHARTGRPFWWDRWRLSGRARPESDLREEAVHRLAGVDERIDRWAERRGWSPIEPPGPMRPAGPDELERLVGVPGATVGSHGWTHVNLTRLRAPALRKELRRPLSWLEDRELPSTPCISYPYGCYGEPIGEAAAEAGYQHGFRIGGGWTSLPSSDTPLAIPRVHVDAGLSEEGFRLRAGGWLCT